MSRRSGTWSTGNSSKAACVDRQGPWAIALFSETRGIAHRGGSCKQTRTGSPVGAHPQIRSVAGSRSEEHTSELQSLMCISYAVFCLKKKNRKQHNNK